MSESDEKTQKLVYCSFCSKSNVEVRKLIAGPSVFICDECVELCNDIIIEEGVSKLEKAISPQQLIAAADQAIPGQAEAKRLLAAAIAQHYARRHSLVSGKLSSLLVVGPTGSGKTEVVKCMVKTLDIAFAVIDAPLLFAGSAFKAKHEFIGFDEKPGVVLLNRIDAAAMRGSDKDAARLVQESLISILDGAVVSVVGQNDSPVIDTSRVLFIAVGTFADWPSSSERFGAEAFMRYGFLPELAARFGTFLQFEVLGKDSLETLLTRDGGLIGEYERRFKKDGIGLIFNPAAVDLIASLGEQRRGGVRGLKAIMDSVALALAFEVPADGEREFVVDEAFVKQIFKRV